MKLPEVKKFANELTGLLRERDGTQQAIDQMTALMRAASGAGDRNRQLAIEKQRGDATKYLVGVEKELLAMTKARDVEGARQLQTDIALRIEEASRAYTEWRRMVNEYEYSVDNNMFSPEPAEGEKPTGFTRAMGDSELEKAKQAVEMRVVHAAKAVPERAVVLL